MAGIPALFTVTRMGRQPRGPSAGEQIDKMVHTPNGVGHSRGEDKSSPLAGKGAEQRITMLRKVSWTQEDTDITCFSPLYGITEEKG